MTVKYKWAYDPTGKLGENLVAKENHSISTPAPSNYAIIVPTAAPLFEHNLVVRHVGSNTVLKRGTHYELGHYFEQMSGVLLKNIYGSIFLLDRNLSGQFEITYQTIGGKFVLAPSKILKLLINRTVDPKKVSWEQIQVTPKDYLPFAFRADTEDMVGQSEVVTAIDNIRKLMVGITELPHKHNIDDIRGLQKVLEGSSVSKGSVKYGVGGSVKVVDDKKWLAVTLPEFSRPTAVYLKLSFFSPTKMGEFYISGTTFERNLANAGNGWTHELAEFIGDVKGITCALSYDTSKHPVVYIQPKKLVGCHVVIAFAVLDVPDPEKYNKGWSVHLVPRSYGNPKPMVEKAGAGIEIPYASTTKAGTVKLVDSSTNIDRNNTTLAATPATVMALTGGSKTPVRANNNDELLVNSTYEITAGDTYRLPRRGRFNDNDTIKLMNLDRKLSDKPAKLRVSIGTIENAKEMLVNVNGCSVELVVKDGNWQVLSVFSPIL